MKVFNEVLRAETEAQLLCYDVVLRYESDDITTLVSAHALVFR